MITISTVSWPTESAKEMGRRFFELSPLPDFIRTEGPYMVSTLNQGIKAITIYKYDKAKAAEANEAIAYALRIFYGVPGFRYALELAAGPKTGLKMAGSG